MAKLAVIDSREVFLRGQYVLLKALTERDALESNWFGWFNDTVTTSQMQKHYFPNTAEDQLQFFKTHILGSKDKLQLGICDIRGGPVLGMVSLGAIDPINRKAEFSAIIGEKAARNVQFYIEATKLIINHGFNTLNLHRVYGGALSKENAMILCRAIGFKEEGVARQDVYKNGQYRDAYLFGLLKEDFKSL